MTKHTTNTHQKRISTQVKSKHLANNQRFEISNHDILAMMKAGLPRSGMADYIGISEQVLRDMVEYLGLKRIKAKFHKSFTQEVDNKKLPVLQVVTLDKPEPEIVAPVSKVKKIRAKKVKASVESDFVDTTPVPVIPAPIEEKVEEKTPTPTQEGLDISDLRDIEVEEKLGKVTNNVKEFVRTVNAALRKLNELKSALNLHQMEQN